MFGFNKKKAKLKNCLGIYISVEGAVIADVCQEGSSARVTRFVRVPFVQVKRTSGETTKMSTLNAEFLDNEMAWLEPIKKALEEGEWSTKKACVALSSQFSVLRHFIMPMIAPRFRKQSVPFESKKYVPFPFEDSFYDYYAYGVEEQQSSSAKGRMGVLFSLTNKRVSQSLLSGLQKIGVEVQAIESSPVAVSRIVHAANDGNDAGPQALAHFNPSTACLIVSNAGIPVLFREVNFGDSQSTERRRLDLKGSIDFVGKQFGGELAMKEVLVSGENLDLWKNLVAEETKLPVNVWEPHKFVGVQESEWGVLSAAGAAAQSMIDYPVVMDLRGIEKDDSDEKTANVLVWSVVGVILGVLLLASVFQHARLYMLRRDLAAAKMKTEIIDEFAGKDPEVIKVEVEALAGRVRTFGTVFSNIDYMTPKLEALVNAMPDKVWVKSLSYKSQLRVAQSISVPLDYSMAGSAQTGDAAKDITMLNQFRDSFKSQPAIEKVFSQPNNGKCDMSIQTSGKSSTEQETTFTLACSAK